MKKLFFSLLAAPVLALGLASMSHANCSVSAFTWDYLPQSQYMLTSTTVAADEGTECSADSLQNAALQGCRQVCGAPDRAGVLFCIPHWIVDYRVVLTQQYDCGDVW